MSVNASAGDWIKYNVGEPYDLIGEVATMIQGYYVLTSGVYIYPSQIIESRPPQGEVKENV